MGLNHNTYPNPIHNITPNPNLNSNPYPTTLTLSHQLVVIQSVSDSVRSPINFQDITLLFKEKFKSLTDAEQIKQSFKIKFQYKLSHTASIWSYLRPEICTFFRYRTRYRWSWKDKIFSIRILQYPSQVFKQETPLTLNRPDRVYRCRKCSDMTSINMVQQ